MIYFRAAIAAILMMVGMGCAQGAPRYQPSSQPVFYVDQNSGADTNDCLTTATACRTINGAFNVACNTLDSQGYWPLIQGAPGQTYTVPFVLQHGGLGSPGMINQPFCVGFDQITIDLAGSTLAAPPNQNAILIRGVPMWVALQNMTLTAHNGNDAECYGGGATLEVVGSGVIFGAVDSPYAQVSATRFCRFVTRLGATLKFSGGGGFAAQSIVGGGIEIEVPVQFIGSPAYTQACYQATDGAYLTFYSAPQTGTPRCAQWQIQKGGIINTSGQSGAYTPAPGFAANTYLPGDAPGYYGLNGGVFDNPGTPTARSCGTPSGISGTDRSGVVVLGPGAGSSCSLNFTTLTGYSCVATAAAPVAIGIGVVGPTGQSSGSKPGYMQFSYSGNPGAVYWHCEAPLY